MPRPATIFQLTARTVVLRAVAPWALDLRIGPVPLYDKLMRDLDALIHLAGANRVTDTAEILGSLSVDLCAGLARLMPTSSGPLSEIIAAITGGIGEYSANPIDPYSELFAQVLSYTRHGFYDRFAVWQGKDVQFSLRAAGRHLRPGFGRFPVEAYTNPPGGTTEVVKVELRISAHDLDMETMAAIPYVLAHECVCHAGQGNGEVANFSLFTEGWMDFVAELLTEDAADSLDWGFLAYEYSRASRSLIGDVLCQEKSGVENWAERSRGRWCAQQLLRLLSRMPPTALSPRERLYSVSAKLNASPLSNTIKDMFAHRVGTAARLETTRAELVRTFRRWEEGDSPVEDLVDLVR
jgi:hypothetical protein